MNSKRTNTQAVVPTILSLLAIFISYHAPVHAFSSFSLQTQLLKTNTNERPRVPHSLNAHKINGIHENKELKDIQKGITSLTFAAMIALSSTTLTPGVAQAYEDYTDTSDVETVANVIQSLKDSSGDIAASFKTFESISEIITEGKGVGGMISSCKFDFF
jgi:hypothetical protein